MIPLAVPDLAGNESRYLQDCVDSTFVSSVGAYVDRFESMVAAAAGSAGAVATSAGTTGLHAALVAVGVGRDDLVILPSFTFIASANAIAHAGAEPWLFDVDAASWTLAPDQVEAALARDTEQRDGGLYHRPSGRRVAAMMPVYTLGMPADMDRLTAIAQRYGLPVVADAAAALGACYMSRPIGALGAGLTVFSFNGNKTVTAGGGGIVAGDDETLVNRVRHLTTTARVGRDYTHDAVGFNYRMTNLQAAVGCAQMERLETLVSRKRAIAETYREALADLPGTKPFPRPAWAESACWFSGITVDAAPETMTALREHLRAAGVDARPFWKPVHLQPPYAEAPHEVTPVTDAIWARILTLPCSTGLAQDDQARVIAAVREALAAVAGPCAAPGGQP